MQRVSGKRTVPVAGSVLLAHVGFSCAHVVYLTKGGDAPDQKFIDVRMNAARRRIIVVSGKGGKKLLVSARFRVFKLNARGYVRFSVFGTKSGDRAKTNR